MNEAHERFCRPLMLALALLFIPSLAHAHLYALPTGLVTVPVLLLALLVLWPWKSLITSHLQQLPFLHVLGRQALSSVIVLIIFTAMQILAVVPFVAMAFWIDNYPSKVQWGMIITGGISILLLTIPAWNLEKKMLSSSEGESNAGRSYLGIINLAVYLIIALAIGYLLYTISLNAYNNEHEYGVYHGQFHVCYNKSAIVP